MSSIIASVQPNAFAADGHCDNPVHFSGFSISRSTAVSVFAPFAMDVSFRLIFPSTHFPHPLVSAKTRAPQVRPHVNAEAGKALHTSAVIALHSRRHDVEPERKRIEQSYELRERFAAALDLEVARGDGLLDGLSP